MLPDNHFKRFNDSFGHLEGNTVLQGVARTLKKLSRATDLVCRYGGEEFALLLPDTGQEGAMLIAERLRQCVDNSNFSERHVSIGIATYQGGHVIDARNLFEVADRALYSAKDQGRNRAMADLAAA